MKSKLILVGLLAAALSAVTASAHLLITVACPNGGGGDLTGIKVTATQVGGSEVESGTTDSTGFVELSFINIGDFTVCVDTTTLPSGAILATPCQVATVPLTPLANSVTFDLSGAFCTPAPGLCWMTGGGTIVIGPKKNPDYFVSYGGVVYPGCSPKAADGGNWNVVDHVSGIHFQGEHIVVDHCSGLPTKSPKVPVRIIDFHGDGEVSGVAGNPTALIPVTFVGRAIDNKDGGANSDMLYLSVTDGTTTWLQIGNSANDPMLVSTGNLQIHISSCARRAGL